MDERAMERYARWRECATDADTAAELAALAGDAQGIEDAFYRDLAFGTGGLRGVIGAGTNRMNIYTVAKASQGLADYLNARFAAPSVAIGYDSRIKSELFARTAAGVFAANGVHVHIWPELMPVPTVSFAVRRLGASAGVMITASHNPAQYNGYKVYGADGCQITTRAAEDILAEIEKLDVFDGVRQTGFDEGLEAGMIRTIPEAVYAAFIGAVKRQSVLFGTEADRGVKIVYTPLNGAGRGPVLRALREAGFTDVSVVAEQEQPDGRFPTCPYPNPEVPAAMALGIEYAKALDAELLLATDPDCDRVGVAVRDGAGDYALLTGNETGLLLLDYICARRTAAGAMPDGAEMIKTIVTTDLGERVAARYGVRTQNVLTGFKYIGERIGRLEQEGHAERFIFGFEESYGYLSGPYVRDKDGVGAALMICEMLAYYKARGVSLTDRLNALYAEHGYCLNTLHSYAFEGAAGFARMREIMAAMRGGAERIGGKRALSTLDYLKGLDGLPKADVLKFQLEDGCAVVVRPSGTEPKLKAYVSVTAANREEAKEAERRIAEDLEERFR